MNNGATGPGEAIASSALSLVKIRCGRCGWTISEVPAGWQVTVTVLPHRHAASGHDQVKRCPRGDCRAWNELHIVGAGAPAAHGPR